MPHFLQLGQTEVRCYKKNCTPKIYRHNFGDCCPILTILSALWTENLRLSADWNLPPHRNSVAAYKYDVVLFLQSNAATELNGKLM